MIRCPYCGYELDYCETIVVNEKEHKFYNIFQCPNDKCISNQDKITDCTGDLAIGHIGCCYPEELKFLQV